MDPFRLLMLSIENLLIHVKCQVPNMSRCQMSCGKINSFKMSVETTDPWCQMSLVRCQMSLVNVPSMQHSGKRPLNLSHKIDEAFLSKWSSLSRFTIISHQIYIYIYIHIYIYNCVSCESCWTETCWQLRLRSGHWNWQKLASNGFKTSRCQTASVLDVICHPIRIGKELMSDTQSTIVKQSFNARCQTTRVGTKLLSEMPSKSARLKPQGSEKQSGSVKECNNEFDVRN